MATQKKINVLSVFNGMNTGRQALENCGFKIEKYYSSEIKPYAIKLTQHHFPDTIQVGDVTTWREWNIDWGNIDLILSGSPCQDLSGNGKRAGIYGEKSSLFFVFVDIRDHINQERRNQGKDDVIFFQENVGTASKKDIGIMSVSLGIYPVRINSELVTAQTRDRYYWTNIKTKKSLFDIVTHIPEPSDKKIMLKDIIQSGFTERKKATALVQRTGKSAKYKDMMSDKAQRYLKKRSEKSFISVVTEKTKEGEFLRLFNQTELERLQGFPDGYTSIVNYEQASSLLGDGWTLPIVEHFFSFLTFK